MKRHWTDDLTRGREWTRAHVLGDDVCNFAIASGSAPSITKRSDTPAVVDHEYWTTGVIYGFVAGMNDGRDPASVAQDHSDAWAKVTHQMHELLDHPMSMVYGVPWMPRNVKNANGVTVKLQDADAATLTAVRNWNDQYQRPIAEPFPAVMPQCYLALKDGALPDWEIYWLHAQIAEARRIAGGRPVVPIISFREQGHGAIMRPSDWQKVVYAVWAEGVERVVVWEWTAQPLSIACEPDYPTWHGGHQIQLKHRKRIEADLNMVIDWATPDRDLLLWYLTSVFKRRFRPFIDTLDEVELLPQEGDLPASWASTTSARATGRVWTPPRTEDAVFAVADAKGEEA